MLLTRLAERVFLRSREYAVFVASPARQLAAVDSSVQTFDVHNPPAANVPSLYRKHAGSLNSRVMMRRLHRGYALLLALIEDGEMRGYGWIQTWRPLAREFWWLDRDGICLGPYWTHRDFRGHGIYGRLLSHSLRECADRWGDKKWYIWARSDNAPSIRGIEKSGFEPLGLHRVSLYAGGLFRRHAPVTGDR